MESKDYKKYHEEHMMLNTGTSSAECWILLSTIPLTVFISSCISKFHNPVLEFMIIIVPVTLTFTILSDQSYVIFLNILLISITVIFVKIDKETVQKCLDLKIESKASFITNYRSATNLFSALCILAVDFTIFPKRFIKTETFGFGLMDLGVGFFICSNGLVEKHTPAPNQFIKILKNVAVLLVLGFGRLLSVKSLDYHEHTSEYGVHWNFFFTLATCRIVSYVIMKLTQYANPFWLALATGIIHQSLLKVGLQEWVLSNTPRNSFLAANREGVTSCLGYICLYFCATSLGRFIFSSVNYKKLLTKLLTLSFLLWGATIILSEVTEVSRRLVNLGYIFWVLALTTTELILFIVTELAVLGIRKEKPYSTTASVPFLFDSVNSNGLFFFLCANLLTGLVNTVFQTLLIGRIFSLVIIISYMIVLCSITYFLKVKNIFLKL